MRRRGWFGNSHGHSLAARGIRSYNAEKQMLVEPIFYAQKREAELPFSHVVEMVRKGMTWNEMQQMHPSTDKEDLRQRGIRAYESINNTSALSQIDKNGVEASYRLAKMPGMRRKMHEVLTDTQATSFLPKIKVDALKERLGEK